MRKFSYKAKKEGIDISGIIEAKGEKEAAKLLHEQNLFVVSVIPERKQNILFFKNRVGLNDVVNLTRQLSSMITAGLTITEALSVLGSEVENPLLSQILEEILTDVEAGNSLSAAMAKHPKVFSSVYIAMITAAEEAGLLDKVLARLADNLEKEKAFRGKIIGALIYPIIVVVGMVAVGVIMMLFVIPTVRGLYQDLGVDLPAMTQVVLAISDFMVKGWPLLAGLGALLFFAFSSYKKTDLGQRQLDTILLRAPIIGKLRKLIILTEFSRTLGLLIGSGSPIIESINITGNTTGSIW
ncbi:type II secretion system F family protein [Candidatus Microgenomates bacterium]|nr:type II secretion system F family protein [Candidatus Microgenomates bacterium]